MSVVKLHAVKWSCPRCPAEVVVVRSEDAVTFAHAHRPECPGRGVGSPGARRAATECRCGHRGAKPGAPA